MGFVTQLLFKGSMENHENEITRMAGWLVGWLVGWLAGWLVGWLVGRLVGWLAGWTVGWLVGRLVGWLLLLLSPLSRVPCRGVRARCAGGRWVGH